MSTDDLAAEVERLSAELAEAVSQATMRGERAARAEARTDALMEIIDVLWGELPADVVIGLAGKRPEIVDACREIHRLLEH